MSKASDIVKKYKVGEALPVKGGASFNAFVKVNIPKMLKVLIAEHDRITKVLDGSPFDWKGDALFVKSTSKFGMEFEGVIATDIDIKSPDRTRVGKELLKSSKTKNTLDQNGNIHFVIESHKV
jgi:hypothetical protein